MLVISNKIWILYRFYRIYCNFHSLHGLTHLSKPFIEPTTTTTTIETYLLHFSFQCKCFYQKRIHVPIHLNLDTSIIAHMVHGFVVSIQSLESEIMINQRNNVCYLIFSFSSWFLFSIAFQVFDLLILCYTFHWNIERLSIVTHWKFVLMITITWKLLVFIQTIDCQCAIFFPSVLFSVLLHNSFNNFHDLTNAIVYENLIF